ncbi:MAG: SH3 domain-containing protein, partial [Clostridiales bacterium]|nr:SH3 domain-containing protein [Clostridiales bacterium]
MGKIRATDLIDLFERMARERWAYEWGAAREGCVDCSGAFVYAFKALGGPAIAHGSNTIARRHCGAMVSASEAKPGYAVFRWREDGEPERYENDGKDDFYHIGLMGRSGTVLNAKSTAAGFVESPLAGWTYAAPLLAVDYDETKGEDTLPEYTEVLYRAKVVTQNDPLNLREQPNTSSRKIGELPRGAVVDVLDTSVNAG